MTLFDAAADDVPAKWRVSFPVMPVASTCTDCVKQAFAGFCWRRAPHARCGHGWHTPVPAGVLAEDRVSTYEMKQPVAQAELFSAAQSLQ